MQINLRNICLHEKKMEDVEIKEGVWVKRAFCSIERVRKLFKLIVQESDQGTIEQVQHYLDFNSKEYGRIFAEIRSKGR
jgi:hypothetical protein